MKDCPEIVQLLVEFTDGDLPAGEIKPIVRHLAECPDCRKVADGFETSLSAMKALMEAEGKATADQSVANAVMAEIRNGKGHKRRFSRKAWAMAAAFVLFFLGSAGLMYFKSWNNGGKFSLKSGPALVIHMKGDRLDIEDRVEGTIRAVNVRP